MASDINFDKWYAAGFTCFHEATNKCQSTWGIDKHLGKISARIGLDRCHSLLSIGPGPGYVDVPLIRDYLPGLEQYYGVEPRVDALKELRQWIQKDIGDRMESKLIAENVENWSGPPDGVRVDVILMIHVLYHITDKQTLMKKCLNWLKPGGLLVIVHVRPEGIFQRCAQYVNLESSQSYTSVQVVDDFQAVGISRWIEERIPMETDMRNPKKVLIDFILNKEATASEVEKLKEFTREFAPSGVYYNEEQMFITTK